VNGAGLSAADSTAKKNSVMSAGHRSISR